MAGVLVVGVIALVALVVMWLNAGRPTRDPFPPDPLGRSGPYTRHELGLDALDLYDQGEDRDGDS